MGRVLVQQSTLFFKRRFLKAPLPQLPQQVPLEQQLLTSQRGAEASTAAESALPGDQHSRDPEKGSHSHHPCHPEGLEAQGKHHAHPLHLTLKRKLHLQFLEGLTASLHAWVLSHPVVSFICIPVVIFKSRHFFP